MTDLSSLIAKLEQAESGSRELDAEIAVAVGYVPYVMGKVGTKWVLDNKELWRLPPFSESLDAALTLVPDGAMVRLCLNMIPGPALCYIERLDGPSVIELGNASAATPAVALCIASLKARSRADGKA